MKKKGFTLIELLVVVAIIGLLATLSIVALNNARARARDAKRVADVKQIQTALELYYNDQGAYPTGGSLGTSIATGSPVITYMSQVPTPPQPADGACSTTAVYTYTSDDSNRSYHINYCLGTATGNLGAGNGVATPGGMK